MVRSIELHILCYSLFIYKNPVFTVHCWDYRHFIVKKSNVPDIEEFEFSTSKILNNFSNYSSWHYRSKLLSKMFPDDTKQLPIRADKYKEGKNNNLVLHFVSFI